MGGSSGGGSETKTSMPQFWQDAAKELARRGQITSQIGYVPYQGPEVAAFNPQMVDAMQQAQNWSSAFNTPGQAPPNVAASIPTPQTFAGGLTGYSSYPGFQEEMGRLEAAYPGQANLLRSFFVNPVTGKSPGKVGVPSAATNIPGTPPPTIPGLPDPNTPGTQNDFQSWLDLVLQRQRQNNWNNRMNNRWSNNPGLGSGGSGSGSGGYNPRGAPMNSAGRLSGPV